jgi:glycosyltransferase involved in cell wall biosynthesis
MKIALVHDDFCQLGGAERLFEEVAKIYPDAPIFTALFDRAKIPKSIDPKRLESSFIQKIPFAKNFYKALLPLYPLAFESFDFSGFDLVISSTTRFAKAIITQPGAKHICYINSTPRFLYNDQTQKQYLSKPLLFLAKPYLNWLKRWDKVSSARPDFYIANSKNIQKQIKQEYNRDSSVVYPAVDTEFFKPGNRILKKSSDNDYYLVVSRLNKWKKIDIAIEACIDLNQPLIIVGIGPDEIRLKSLADKSSNINFLENTSKEQLLQLYQNAKGLIVTQKEDFGISIVEAQACGKPVIAFAKGGALEIIINGKTGLFFKEQTVNSLKDAISAQSKLKWDISTCRENSLRFSKATFINRFKKTIGDYVKRTH